MILFISSTVKRYIYYYHLPSLFVCIGMRDNCMKMLVARQRRSDSRKTDAAKQRRNELKSLRVKDNDKR